MTTHVVRLDRYCAQAEGVRGRLVLGTWDSYGIEQLQLVLGDGWDGRTVTAVFHGPKASIGTTVLAGSDGLVSVPQEATAAAGYGTITIVGVDESSQRISVDIPYVVMSHAPVTGQSPDPTPDQWQQFVAAVKADADRAEQAAKDASTSADAAEKSAQAAAESAKQAAQATADIGEAKDDALEAIHQAQDTGVQAVEGETTAGVQAVQQAHQAALDDIATERETALEAVQTEGDKQQSAIAGAGTAALEAIGQTEQAAIGQVQQAGQAQLDKINAANALVPTPTQEDAGKAIIVKPDGSGYELGEVQTDSYTKAESDARYAPIEAAIRPTVSGNPATLEHSVAWAMQGLNVYGKSTQDGTPSPDSPVPIVSAGESGSITVTVSDGADQSQQLSISTPNGLPGILVDSGGNFTDASGQQWVCDEVDFEKGVYVQRTKYARLPGSGYTTDIEISEKRYVITVSQIFGRLTNNRHPIITTVAKTLSPIVQSVQGQIFQYGSNVYWYCTDYFSSLEELNAYLDENEVMIVGQLKTPIETPLSAEELAAYAALRSYNGTTIVSTEAPVAGLSTQYVADGAAYIDGKIQSALAPVNQAILEAKTNV